MELYSSKKRWKWLLFFSACIVFAITIYYSNILLNDIAKEERKKVSLWADAISYKADLVAHTDHFFDNIRTEEGKRAALLVRAFQKVNEAGLNEDITFYIDFISANATIPTIVTNEKGDINYKVNVDEDVAQMSNIAELGERKAEYDSLKIEYYRHEYNYVYYKESQIYTNLHLVIDNLIQSFFQEVVINTASVPVIVTDSTEHNVITFGNIDSTKFQSPETVSAIIADMRSENTPIKIDLPEAGTCYVFYQESPVLTRLRYFPYIQFFIIFVFLIIAYLLFSVTRRSEQNQVWLGMSKETAHQLGTPISSLMAWNELLKSQDVDNTIISEIDKDVHRLETIAQRFSKIGSVPELKDENLIQILRDFISYLQTRISAKVKITLLPPPEPEITLPLNRYLFEWVIENLCKNSVDAMDGDGNITISIQTEKDKVHIDVSDTGKGMPSNKKRTIFKPGYTSKSRGWGLGLTLAKRIIKEYHKGKLFVKSTAPGKGTVMRITLNKSQN